MTKAELVAAMAARAGLDKRDTMRAMDAFIACVTDCMRSGEDVRIVGFGNFSSSERPAGRARNPKTGAQVARPASRVLRFRAGEGLKNAIQK